MNSYTVRLMDECRVILGSVPVIDMAILLKGWADHGGTAPADEWIIDAELAERMQATMVCGPRAAIEALRNTWGNEHVETRHSSSV